MWTDCALMISALINPGFNRGTSEASGNSVVFWGDPTLNICLRSSRLVNVALGVLESVVLDVGVGAFFLLGGGA